MNRKKKKNFILKRNNKKDKKKKKLRYSNFSFYTTYFITSHGDKSW